MPSDTMPSAASRRSTWLNSPPSAFSCSWQKTPQSGPMLVAGDTCISCTVPVYARTDQFCCLCGEEDQFVQL